MVRDVCRDPLERYTANPECANERIRMHCSILASRRLLGSSLRNHSGLAMTELIAISG